MLAEFRQQITADSGMDLADFRAGLKDVFAQMRVEQDLDDRRISKGRWKQIEDEVLPVERFLSYRGIHAGRVRFPLNNDPPDCFFWPQSSSEPRSIEVTVARGNERFHLMTELNDTGWGRGFINLPDDSSRQDFKMAVQQRREAYSTEDVLKLTKASILDRMERKARKERLEGCDLLIQAPLSHLPSDRWTEIEPELRSAAAPNSLRNIFVIADKDVAPYCICIKGGDY